MLTLRKVALTGSLSAGKTTVAQVFRELGAYVVSADDIVHRLLSPKNPLGEQVIRLFGPEIVEKEELSRKKLASLSFSSPEKLAALETLLHPAVFDEIDREYKKIAHTAQYPLFVAEVPLLYETEQEKKFDVVITVVATEAHCKERFTKDFFDLRMKRQLPSQIKAARSDYVIKNDGTIEQLKAQARRLYFQLIHKR